jgi:hypothetical protein
MMKLISARKCIPNLPCNTDASYTRAAARRVTQVWGDMYDGFFAPCVLPNQITKRRIVV